MTKILGLANSCKECPNRHYYSGGTYECLLTRERLNADSSIPAWCPLADHPATALELANTRIAYLTDQNKRIIAAADTQREADAATIAGLRQELENIANAKPAEWDDPSQFEAWAKSRARHALEQAK